MVSTRSHPTPLPTPSSSSPSKSVAATPSRGSRPGRPRKNNWSHTPTPLTLLWLLVSLPLVIWDTGYVLFRPHTFPGGALHYPLYVPYALYGKVDKIYGVQAWEERNGFTAAQGSLNVVETVGYLAYLWVIWRYGTGSGAGAERGVVGKGLRNLGFDGAVGGGWGGVACLAGYSLSIATLAKTVLYGLNEAFSGFNHIGHNDPVSLVFCWIIPNGMWIVLPTYMAYIFANEILAGLAMASGDYESTPARAAIMAKEE